MGYIFCFIMIYFIYYALIKTPINIIKHFIEYIDNKIAAKRYTESKNMIIEELEKNRYLETKQIQDRIIQKDKSESKRREIIKRQNEIATAAINKTNELKARYPFADEDLFNLYQLRYVVALNDELKQIENNIRISHEINNQYVDKSEKIYTLKDLDGITPLEHINEYPIVLKLFKMDQVNYVIYVRDIDTGHIELLNSNDYVVIRKTMSSIKEKQKQLAIRKEKITSKEITNIYDNVRNAIQKMRESGTLTI